MGHMVSLRASHGRLRSTTGHMGHLWASTGLYAHLPGLYDLRATTGHMGLLQPLWASTRIHWPLMGLSTCTDIYTYPTTMEQSARRGGTADSFLRSFLSLASRSPFSRGVWIEGLAFLLALRSFVWLATLFWALVGALNTRTLSFSSFVFVAIGIVSTYLVSRIVSRVSHYSVMFS